MEKTLYKIKKMDCPSEERLIRMKLDRFPEVKDLIFDLAGRQLTIFHEGHLDQITLALDNLKLDSILVSSTPTEEFDQHTIHMEERRLLWLVLWINFGLFIAEVVAGFISRSMGLIADSLDMLADAIVYGLSLYAVGKMVHSKKKVAKISSYLQITLAILGFGEVVRRFFGLEEIPEFSTMIIVSLLALSGNGISLWILQKSKSQEAHIKASLIFTSNDVLVNLGVIIAGCMVYFTNSKYPDLVVGAIVFFIVAKGALKIYQLSK